MNEDERVLRWGKVDITWKEEEEKDICAFIDIYIYNVHKYI